MTEPNYWLMKSEPNVYSIANLQAEVETLWDGIRNYQARNYMRLMNINDEVFFYHSNCKPPGIVGLMKVVEVNLVDPTQFDQKSKYHDPKSTKNNPRWDCPRLKYLKTYKKILSLQEISSLFKPEELVLIRKGNRLSVMPILANIAERLKCILEKE